MTRAGPSPDPLALDRLHAVARPRPGPPRTRAPVGPPSDPPSDRPAGASSRGSVDAGRPPDHDLDQDDDHDGPARRARHRTVPALGGDAVRPEPGVPPTVTRWLPVRPAEGAGRGREVAPAAADHAAVGPGTGPPPPDRGRSTDVAPTTGPVDVVDVAARSRQTTLAAAAAGYTATYGHPLDHPAGDRAPTRRWWLSTRHAVVAGIAVLVLAAGVVVRASTQVHGAPEAVVPPAVQVATGPDGAGGAAPATDGLPGGGPAREVPAAAPTLTAPAGAGAVPAGVGPPGTVVVHVVGQVAAAGVLTLPAGSRVADALAGAGGAGPSADLSAVNLARVVVDGEQIHVPAHGEAQRPAPPGPAVAAPGAPVGPVDLNAADATALDGLPGIGPVLAQRIVEWRRDNGAFRSVEELGEVSGIGDALLTRLRPLVRV